MAGNARFHNKYHRRGHHTDPSDGYPDSGTDPIASQAEPFLGDFHLAGNLSANKNLFIGQDATIMGNLSVMGDLSYLDTIVSVTSALSVVNVGTGPALTVVQYGAQPIAKFIDKEGTCTLLVDDGGFVGFNTCILEPGIGITINNTISSNQALTANANLGAYHFLIGSVAEGRNTRPTGAISHAEGDNTIASNNATHAEGYYTSATGQYGAHAEGALTRASGLASHAEGNGTRAAADSSHAEGALTVATGIQSHAEGYSTSATSDYTHAEGYYAKASEVGSHAEGDNTNASGGYSHAEGSLTTAAGDASHAEGANTSALNYASHAEGFATQATGSYSHAEGIVTNAVGDASHAQGSNTLAIGEASHAEGLTTKASGSYSHAEGEATQATAQSTHAEGFSTSATNIFAHAEGKNTLASEQAAHAEGEETVASGEVSHAQGSRSLASGFAAHAEGEDTIASANYAHAEGKTTVASGQASHAGGTDTRASNTNSFAHGLNVGASGINSFALGENSVAKNGGDIALGSNANAVHAQSLVYSNYSNYYSSCSFADNTFNVFASGGSFLLDPVTVGDPVSAIKFIVTGDGLVGVNTANPNEQLTINGNVSSNATVMTNVLSAKFIHVVHTPANDGANPIIRIGETDNASGNAGFSGMHIAYSETTNVFGISSQFAPGAGLPAIAIDRFSNTGLGTDSPGVNQRLTISGNTSGLGVATYTSPNYGTLLARNTTYNGQFSALAIDPLTNLVQGRLGINTAPVSSYALHVKGGNIRVDGVDYSAAAGTVGFDGTVYDTDGQSLFDLRSGFPDANYSLSIAQSGLGNFLKLFGGRLNDDKPFINVKKNTPMRFGTFDNFYGTNYEEHMRIGRTGNIGIHTNHPWVAGAYDNAVNEALTVNGNISANGSVITPTISSRFINLVHSPANDGTNPYIRIGETDNTSGNLGFSGAFISYNETTNVFGISSVFEGGPGLPAMAVDRFSRVGIGTDAPGEKLTVSGNISANASVIASSVSSRYLDLIHTPANDGTYPVLRIGETDTTGFTGFKVTYDENLNKMQLVTDFGGVALTAASIDRNANASGPLFPYMVTLTPTITTDFNGSTSNIHYPPALSGVIPASEITNRFAYNKGVMQLRFHLETPVSVATNKRFRLEFANNVNFNSNTNVINTLDASFLSMSTAREGLITLSGSAPQQIVFQSIGASTQDGRQSNLLATYTYVTGDPIYWRCGLATASNTDVYALCAGYIRISPY
jgi:hypothetical protein